MVGHPVDHGALDRHLAQPGERVLEPALRRERSMREQPVEAHRDPEARQQVHDDHDDDVGRADELVPEEEHRQQEGDRRDQDRQQVHDLVRARHGFEARTQIAPPLVGLSQRIGRSVVGC
jgi:hypothetical protein